MENSGLEVAFLAFIRKEAIDDSVCDPANDVPEETGTVATGLGEMNTVDLDLETSWRDKPGRLKGSVCDLTNDALEETGTAAAELGDLKSVELGLEPSCLWRDKPGLNRTSEEAKAHGEFEEADHCYLRLL